MVIKDFWTEEELDIDIEDKNQEVSED